MNTITIRTTRQHYRWSVILSVLILIALIPMAYGQTNQMTNGSFEVDPVPGGAGYTTTFTGWVASGGNCLRNNSSGPFYTAANGAIPNGAQVAGIQGGAICNRRYPASPTICIAHRRSMSVDEIMPVVATAA